MDAFHAVRGNKSMDFSGFSLKNAERDNKKKK
jgi:hypothetical protein